MQDLFSTIARRFVPLLPQCYARPDHWPIRTYRWHPDRKCKTLDPSDSNSWCFRLAFCEESLPVAPSRSAADLFALRGVFPERLRDPTLTWDIYATKNELERLFHVGVRRYL